MYGCFVLLALFWTCGSHLCVIIFFILSLCFLWTKIPLRSPSLPRRHSFPLPLSSHRSTCHAGPRFGEAHKLEPTPSSDLCAPSPLLPCPSRPSRPSPYPPSDPTCAPGGGTLRIASLSFTPFRLRLLPCRKRNGMGRNGMEPTGTKR